MSAVEQDVDLELAHDNLNRMKEKIIEAGSAVSGFRPDSVFYNAEFAAIRQFITAAGFCTEAQYDNLISSYLLEELSDMIDLGIADAGLLDDEMEEEPEDGQL